jgi:hypothetical protein
LEVCCNVKEMGKTETGGALLVALLIAAAAAGGGADVAG